jgi:hypothetical protein
MSEAVNPKAYPLADAQVRRACKRALDFSPAAIHKEPIQNRYVYLNILIFLFAAHKLAAGSCPAGNELQANQEGGQRGYGTIACPTSIDRNTIF